MKAPRIGFMIGFATLFTWATLWGSVMEYNVRSVTLYAALTSEELMRFNSLHGALPGAEVMIGIFFVSAIAGLFVSFIFWAATR